MSTANHFSCGHCGRSVRSPIWFGNTPYHVGCAKPPMPQFYAVPLTEADIRRIVREELERSGGKPAESTNG